MAEFKVTLSNNLLRFKKEFSPSKVEEIIHKNNLNGLSINLAGYSEATLIENFDFLKEYPFLKGLEICTPIDYTYEFLLHLPSREYLSILNESDKQIDLSNLHNLIRLTLRERRNIKGIENCKKLKRIGLIEWKEKDLAILKGLVSIEEIAIKTSTIQNLNILTELKSLRSLLLGNCTRLISIKGITGLQHLKKLEFNLCSKIQDLDKLISLPNLESLTITDCKHIPTIKFVENFPQLKEFNILGNTDILDGDLEPIKIIPNVFIRPREHYNIKIENKKAIEQSIKNIKKIRDQFYKREK